MGLFKAFFENQSVHADVLIKRDKTNDLRFKIVIHSFPGTGRQIEAHISAKYEI